MSLESDVALMAAVPLFAELDAGALRLIGFSAEALRLSAGEVLFRRGDPADAGFLLVTGTVDLHRERGSPREVGPGTLIGEHALVAEISRPVTARSRTEGSVLKIPRDLFQRVLREYPKDALAIRRFWARRLRQRLPLA